MKDYQGDSEEFHHPEIMIVIDFIIIWFTLMVRESNLINF